jgi:transposase InsO family protein
MNDNERNEEALFRLSVLGDLVHRKLRHGDLVHLLKKKAEEVWIGPDEEPRQIAAKTLEAWYYAHKRGGFSALLPKARRDKGRIRAIPEDLQELIVAMKREDPGRSVPLILKELRDAGRMRKNQFGAGAVQRLLKRRGLSGPEMELIAEARYRFVASECGELWQGDACHGPALHDPHSGREVKVKIFALLDDRSRLVPYVRGSFHETQQDFLAVLLGAIERRGIPKSLLLDNHGSFTGTDVRLACAKLNIQLVHARPYDGASKGKIERWWRTLRAHVLDRLDLEKIDTLDDLNLRLSAWVEGEYNHRPHEGLSGRTPLSVWEEDSDKIRWVEDHAALESAFLAKVERKAINDSTCTFRGKVYEVPTHLRGETVFLHYSLLRPELIWIDDGVTRVFLKEVDPVSNSGRPRKKTENSPPPRVEKTGFNPVEDFLRRLLHPDQRDDEAQGQVSHA